MDALIIFGLLLTYLFYSCSFTKDIWNWFLNWCNLSDLQHSSFQQLFLGLPDYTSEVKKRKKNWRLLLEPLFGLCGNIVIIWCLITGDTLC